MYNNLSAHAARTRADEIRRAASRPDALMSYELRYAPRTGRRRRRSS